MAEKTLYEITGSVEQIIFRNEKNEYTVLELNNGRELVTAVGVMPWVSCGEELRLIGEWVNHQSFGQQFKVESFERFRPSTAAAILKYLSSGAVKGIGPGTAAKMVDMFGDRTLEILEKEPERFCAIKGLTRSKTAKFSEEFCRSYGMKETLLSLGKLGITPEEAVRVWKAYGSQSAEAVRQDPYCLCEEGLDVDFIRADIIAESMDRPADDHFRVRAGIAYVLKHNAGNGHTCLPRDKLCETSARLLGLERPAVEAALEEMKADGSLVARSLEGREYLFTVRLYRAEVYAAGRLQMMMKYPAQSILGVEGYISSLEERSGIQYAEGQKQAIVQALSKGILILTGGPGTGKTTTLNAIISILELKGEKVFLTAPTGRAAKRMSELTGREARTIHRLLQVEWTQDEQQMFAKNEKNLLECDALIIDELSMVDAVLFEAVLRALPLGCRLILVGDCDQLPSVGAGNVLGDLIGTGILPVVQLKEIFRQSQQSLIVTNAHRIVSGQMPELRVRNSDFFFLESGDPEEITKTILELYVRRLPNSYGYSPMTDIQVLSPGRKGELGSMELNRKLQAAVNPPSPAKKEITVNGSVLREGDKIMQVKNNYDLVWTKANGDTGEGVFNGDVGVLLEIDKRGETLTVQMDDRLVLYPKDNASELELAYAMTVHKSQGNEFQAVVIPMFRGAAQLSYRNLLYTAVTRAKSLLILVGTEKAVRAMVENDRKTRRYSGLGYFLTGSDENDPVAAP